jgi:PASTA domain
MPESAKAPGTEPGPLAQQSTAPPALVVVPVLSGRSVTEAVALLKGAGLRLGGTRKVESEEQRPDTVLAQQPEPSERVEKGIRIDVVIATPVPITVPNLVGIDIQQARRSLVLLCCSPTSRAGIGGAEGRRRRHFAKPARR